VLREHLWDWMHAAVLTSATLSLDGELAFTRARLGLTGASELVLASPFDVESQALLYIPRDAPDPRAAGWDQAIADHIVAIVRASEGRALCLFTSWRALEAVRRLVAEGLPYPLLVQGEAPRERLLEAFRADVHSVLLATQSFWQGVDVRGEACSCVIIDRLPFAVPSDPLVAGRCEQIVRDGGSAFDDYALPQAALMLRQGFGRLLRSHEDRGVVAVLDGRISTARYAEPLLSALPSVPRVREIADVEAFFARSVELAG
jgi:ATP-dependent DNA helicase DinG